ncbi:putative flagellar associated protein [Paratrimastix pyriformis]|uniref:Flagellar associated protein n=1 Tax=Paratrimastix pyriformis TaxID=342808 RepID=A0ABQ8U8Q7_9EUKA|nr:putative flagellar associated protein [Paratrimastix pyriformis]
MGWAQVTPVTLDLSASELFMTFSPSSMERTVTERVMLSNPGNYPADFEWEGMTDIFTVSPTMGTIEAYSSLPVAVTYNPTLAQGPSAQSANLTLHVGGGLDRTLRVSGEVPEAKAAFVDKHVDFGVLAVGSSKQCSVTLANAGRNDVFFFFESPLAGLAVQPMQGKIAPGASQPIAVTLTATMTRVYDTSLTVSIRGGRQLQLPVKAETKIPAIEVLEKEILFGEVVVGGRQSEVVSLYNAGGIPAVLYMDLSQYPCFTMNIPDPASLPPLPQLPDLSTAPAAQASTTAAPPPSSTPLAAPEPPSPAAAPAAAPPAATAAAVAAAATTPTAPASAASRRQQPVTMPPPEEAITPIPVSAIPRDIAATITLQYQQAQSHAQVLWHDLSQQVLSRSSLRSAPKAAPSRTPTPDAPKKRLGTVKGLTGAAAENWAAWSGVSAFDAALAPLPHWVDLTGLFPKPALFVGPAAVAARGLAAVGPTGGRPEPPVAMAYKIQVQPGQVVRFELVFNPKTPASFEFPLPFALSNLPAPPALLRTVTARAIAPRLGLTSTQVDFGSRVISKLSKTLHKETLVFSNCDHLPLRWAVAAADQPHFASGVFQVTPDTGVLQPGQEAEVQVSFTPTDPVHYSANVGILLDRAEHPYTTLRLQGLGIAPMLIFEPREVILPLVPLGVVSKATFTISNVGYDNLDLKYRLPADTQVVPLALNFPEGTTLSINKPKITVEVSFNSKKSMAFSALIDFFDHNATRFSLPVTGVADNCLLTTAPLLMSLGNPAIQVAKPTSAPQWIPPPEMLPPPPAVDGAPAETKMAQPPPQPARVETAMQDMLGNVSQFVQAYFSAVHGDYSLLQQLNQVTAQRYTEMGDQSQELMTSLSGIMEKYKEFIPYLQQIDQMDVALTQLEGATRSLDEYTKKLEARCRKI